MTEPFSTSPRPPDRAAAIWAREVEQVGGVYDELRWRRPSDAARRGRLAGEAGAEDAARQGFADAAHPYRLFETGEEDRVSI